MKRSYIESYRLWPIGVNARGPSVTKRAVTLSVSRDPHGLVFHPQKPFSPFQL